MPSPVLFLPQHLQPLRSCLCAALTPGVALPLPPATYDSPHSREADLGLAPHPLSLQIERQLFEETVKTLNSFYAEAEKIGGSSYLEGCLACATAYFIFLCMETHYEKVLPPRLPRVPPSGPSAHPPPQPAPLLAGSQEDLPLHPGAE